MADPNRRAKREAKIVRAIVRLKHSLAADEEIEDTLEALREARIAGVDRTLELDIPELRGDS